MSPRHVEGLRAQVWTALSSLGPHGWVPTRLWGLLAGWVVVDSRGQQERRAGPKPDLADPQLWTLLHTLAFHPHRPWEPLVQAHPRSYPHQR